MTVKGETPAPNAEQAADLAALQAAAAEQAPPVAPGAPAEPAAPAAPGAESMAAAALLVGILKPVVCYLSPALKGAPAELWEPLPEGIAGLLDHYGIGEAELMANPWMRAGLSCAPLVVWAAMHQEKPKPDPLAAPVSVTAGTVAPGPAPDTGKAVTVGTVIPA